MPEPNACLECHKHPSGGSWLEVVQKHAQQKTPIPWVRIYRVPEFVFFSHRDHLEADVACGTCHGPVNTREILWKEKETSMKVCVDCHKSHEASVKCNLCHELNQ
ncbi:MAG: cytochrome c3 family protein [Acidobacteriota bacterium]